MITKSKSSAYSELVAAIMNAVPEIWNVETTEVRFSPCKSHSMNLDCLECRAVIHKAMAAALPDHSIGIESVTPHYPEITIDHVLRAIASLRPFMALPCELISDSYPSRLSIKANPELIVEFELGKTLEWHRDHAPETITFLHSLLCKS